MMKNGFLKYYKNTVSSDYPALYYQKVQNQKRLKVRLTDYIDNSWQMI